MPCPQTSRGACESLLNRLSSISKPHPLAFRAKGVISKPFSEKSLWFETCVVMRKDDDSRLTNQFVRSFLRKF